MSLLDTPLVTSNQQIGWSLTCERDWQISLRNVLNDKGNVAAKIRLFAFLKNCPGVGAVGARTLLRALGLSETRTILSLGPVQKARILTALEMIAAIPIINADGSITTPAGGAQAVSGASKDSGSTEFTGETKPAENVTQDDIDKVLDTLPFGEQCRYGGRNVARKGDLHRAVPNTVGNVLEMPSFPVDRHGRPPVEDRLEFNEEFWRQLDSERVDHSIEHLEGILGLNDVFKVMVSRYLIRCIEQLDLFERKG
ncbi:hypothetical protein ACTNA3_02260 [Collinsella sp. HCP28S3_E5]|uniref:hypothetical protein n=1 Tax=Collinsella sp. HCP28S3_E5 TaxID=3438922 RepID=UPI003F8894A1